MKVNLSEANGMKVQMTTFFFEHKAKNYILLVNLL